MSEGLVQRRRPKPAADPDDENGSNNYDNEQDKEDNQNNDDHESKETRLTLMEEVLLLGLKDKEG